MHTVPEIQDLSADEPGLHATERRAELITVLISTAISVAFFVAIGLSLWSRI